MVQGGRVWCTISPDALLVVPAGEGLEGAALAAVTVGAHEAAGAPPVPAQGLLYHSIGEIIGHQDQLGPFSNGQV